VSDIGTGAGIGEALRRRYGLESTRPISGIAPDIFTVMDVSERGLQPELAPLAGMKRYSGVYEITAASATHGIVSLMNPSTSASIVVIDRIIIGGLAAYWQVFIGGGQTGTFPWGQTSGGAPLLGNPTGHKQANNLDSRFVLDGCTDATTSFKSVSRLNYWLTALGNLTGNACELARIGGPAAESGGALEKNWQFWDTPIVLGPGGAVAVQDSELDGELFVTYIFRERQMQDGEQIAP